MQSVQSVQSVALSYVLLPLAAPSWLAMRPTPGRRTALSIPSMPSLVCRAAVETLLLAASRGAVVRVRPDRVGIHPVGVLTADEHAALRAARADRPAIARELLWRVTAMRGQLPPRPLPIPFLVACRDLPSSGGCLSCGDPLPSGHDVRCALCALAVWIALD